MPDQRLQFYSPIGTLSAPPLFQTSVAFGKAGSIHLNEGLLVARGELKQMTNTPHDTILENVAHQFECLKTFDCKQPASESYEIAISNERCVVRALTVEAIDELFTDREQFENCLNDQNELVEPLLNCIDDRQLQFHGQLASLPKSQRRQRLVSSRAALYDNSHPS